MTNTTVNYKHSIYADSTTMYILADSVWMKITLNGVDYASSMCKFIDHINQGLERFC